MISFDVETNIDVAELHDMCTEAEKIVTVQAMKDTRPYVPALTMNMNNRTRILGNHIIYPGPYARYLYMGKVMVDRDTGKGPAYIPGVGYRFRKGAKLVATNRDLKFTKDLHPKAQSHWIVASAAENKEKWKRVAREAVRMYGR